MKNPPTARMLIVDDEATQVEALCDTLQDRGYETAGFTSGKDALAALRKERFDLLLTDLMMPGMDGIALIQAARETDPDLVSVMMTGVGSIATAVAAMKAGAFDYILKPFELSVILPVLSRALAMRRLRMENQALQRQVEERSAELETANRALRSSEAQLRTLAHWAVQAQEDESARLSLALHDNVTQLLCAVTARTHALMEILPPRVGMAKLEATKLREMVGDAAGEVDCILRELRPGVLDILGLVAALRDTGAEFAQRTGVSITLNCEPSIGRLPAKVELSLYRICQLAFDNVERHAHARQFTVGLKQEVDFVQMTLRDDGVGFDANSLARGKESGGLGLLRMRERATYVGGRLDVKSTPNAGTEIVVRIPMDSVADAGVRHPTR
jgi:signal transduction histidine kinase